MTSPGAIKHCNSQETPWQWQNIANYSRSPACILLVQYDYLMERGQLLLYKEEGAFNILPHLQMHLLCQERPFRAARPHHEFERYHIA